MLPIQYAENNEQWEMVEFLRSKTMEAMEQLATSSSSSAAAIEEEERLPDDGLYYIPAPAKLHCSNIDSNSFTVFSFDSLNSCLDMMLEEDEEELQFAEELADNTTFCKEDLYKKDNNRVDDLGKLAHSSSIY